MGGDEVHRREQELEHRLGEEIIEVDAFGYPKRSLSVRRPLAGDDLYLTLDIRLQQLAEELLGAVQVADGEVDVDVLHGDSSGSVW